MRTIHRKAGLIGLLALIFALAPVAAGAAQAAAPLPTLPPHGHIFNGDSPRCLDSGTTKGALLFTCSTSQYQQWVYNRLNEIVGNSPTGCLDDGAGQNGSRAVLVPCTDSPSQQWIGDPSGGTFVNVASGKCLDADLGTIGAQGTIVQVWSCGGASNQIWWFEFVS